MTTTTTTGDHRIAYLATTAAEHLLCETGVFARTRLTALAGNTAEADRLIGEVVQQINNDPVYTVECERLDNPIHLAATSAQDLADKLATYLEMHHDLPCEAAIDLVQGNGSVYPHQGATSPVFITEVKPTFTVTWTMSTEKRVMKNVTAHFINNSLGPLLNRCADHPDDHPNKAWNIAVTNENGDDVTFDFPVFTA